MNKLGLIQKYVSTKTWAANRESGALASIPYYYKNPSDVVIQQLQEAKEEATKQNITTGQYLLNKHDQLRQSIVPELATQRPEGPEKDRILENIARSQLDYFYETMKERGCSMTPYQEKENGFHEDMGDRATALNSVIWSMIQMRHSAQGEFGIPPKDFFTMYERCASDLIAAKIDESVSKPIIESFIKEDIQQSPELKELFSKDYVTTSLKREMIEKQGRKDTPEVRARILGQIEARRIKAKLELTSKYEHQEKDTIDQLVEQYKQDTKNSEKISKTTADATQCTTHVLGTLYKLATAVWMDGGPFLGDTLDNSVRDYSSNRFYTAPTLTQFKELPQQYMHKEQKNIASLTPPVTHTLTFKA